MVFEGNEDIRANLLNWLQTRKTNNVPVRRTTRATVRDADKGNSISSEQSPASEDIPISHPLRYDNTSKVDPSTSAVEGSTIDWTGDAAILEVNPPTLLENGAISTKLCCFGRVVSDIKQQIFVEICSFQQKSVF